LIESCGWWWGGGVVNSVRTYRVFIKEGQKVKAYQTAKICLFRASIEFILTTTYEHLFIYTKDFKYFTLNVI